MLAAEGDEYFHVGRMVAVSIVHGGPGPRCFSPSFYQYLVGKVKTIEAPIEDIPDTEVRNVNYLFLSIFKKKYFFNILMNNQQYGHPSSLKNQGDTGIKPVTSMLCH